MKFLFPILVSSKVTDSHSRSHADCIFTQSIQNRYSKFCKFCIGIFSNIEQTNIRSITVGVKVFSENILLLLWFFQWLCWREPWAYADTWLTVGILNSHLQGCFSEGLYIWRNNLRALGMKAELLHLQTDWWLQYGCESIVFSLCQMRAISLWPWQYWKWLYVA